MVNNSRRKIQQSLLKSKFETYFFVDLQKTGYQTFDLRRDNKQQPYFCEEKFKEVIMNSVLLFFWLSLSEHELLSQSHETTGAFSP